MTTARHNGGAANMGTAEFHRKQAAEYKRLGNLATTESERAQYARLEQEQLLLVDPDPYLLRF